MFRWLTRKPLPTRSTHRPQLECLEDRVVPALTGGPLTVSASSQSSTNPATAMATDANNQSMGVIVWTETNGNGDTDILASFGTPPNSIGSTFTVVNTDSNENNADVAIGQNGNFVVVWAVTENGNSDILYALYKSGQTTPTITGSVASSNLNEVDPHVGMDKNGRFVVTYNVTNEQSTANNGGTVLTQTVRAKMYDPNGNENAVVLVGVSNSVDNFNPRIDMSTGGKFSISYMQSALNQPTTNQKLLVSTYTINSSSTKVSSNGNFKIFASSGSNSIVSGSQDVAVDKNGNTLVVFNKQTSSGQVLTGRRINGGSLASAFTIQASAFDQGTVLRVAMNPSNKDFALTYQNTVSGTPHAFVQEFEKNGTPQSTGPIQLNSTDGAGVQTSNSAISIDLNNNYFIGFQTASNSNDIDAVFGNLA